MLIVEDRADDIELLRIACRFAGLEHRSGGLDIAPNGAAAMQRLQAAQRGEASQPPLVLLDLNLPQVSGLDLLRFIRQHWSPTEMPVFVFTTSNDPRMRERCLELGANQYFVKPDTIAGYKPLLEAIESTLAA